MYVADLNTGTEVRDGSGTANLAKKVVDKLTTPSAGAPRFIPGDLSDIAFIDGAQIAYAIGKAGDVMVRLDYSGANMTIGATQGKPQEINLGTASIDGTRMPGADRPSCIWDLEPCIRQLLGYSAARPR